MKHLLIYMLVSLTLFSHSYRELRDNVFSGGVPRDGIPSIEKPVYIDIQEAKSFMKDEDIVFVWENKDDTTIIPQKILVWHEIINDKDNGKNISITYCPLTASVTGYYSDTSLGVSGKLLNSNLVMYDRDGESLWPQIPGISISPNTQGKTLEFYIEDGKLKDRTFNKIWNYKGESGDLVLEEYRGMDAFWFAWYAFYPETEVINNE